jgi:hypothetical protein
MPTDNELAEFIADCNRRRHGRSRWQAAIQTAARRAADPLAQDRNDNPRTCAGCDRAGGGTCEAYNRGVADAIAGIDALKSGGPS